MANLKLAQVTWDRDPRLVHEGWATQQGANMQTVKANKSAVAAAPANVTAQGESTGCSVRTGTTPWCARRSDSVITQRNVNVGDLVQGNVTGGTLMFEVQQTDPIRVWAYVLRTRPSRSARR